MTKKVAPKKKRHTTLNLLSENIIDGVYKGKGVFNIMSLADPSDPLAVKQCLPTGLPNLDRVLCVSESGAWGLPVGKIISVKSKPGVGKTSFLLKVASQAYRRGGAVAIVESERALDMGYVRKLNGPEVDHYMISQPDTLEEAFDTIDYLLDICIKRREKAGVGFPFLIIVDSFSAFPPKSELEGGFEIKGRALGEHARIASLACRKLTGKIDKAKAILLLSHQFKSKIGAFWGSPNTNIGGEAFNYHDSICISLYRTTAIKDDKNIICGHFGIAKTTKNKLYPPHREIKFKIINGMGFKRDFAILDFLIGAKCVVKKGAWFHFRGDKDLKWQGINNFSPFLRTSKRARNLVRKSLGSLS